MLEKAKITQTNQVWAADITDLPMARGLLYLVAIIDWHSLYVVAWRLTNTLEAGLCLDALQNALGQGRPKVFNTDQGSQFASGEFTQSLQDHQVKISMDGKGRYRDNTFVERFWRMVKYEEMHLKTYANAVDGRRELVAYFRFYNGLEAPSGPGLPDPKEVFHEDVNAAAEQSKTWEGPPEQVLVSADGATGLSIISASFLP